MGRLIFALSVALCMSTTIDLANAEERRSGFTPAQVAEIANSISDDKKVSQRWKWTNQWFDVGAKLLVFGLAAAAAVGAAKAASVDQGTVHASLRIFNSVVTSLATLVTAVAFTQFDFPRRQAVWERRFHALESCEMIIRYRKPDADRFLTQLESIRKWGDSTNLSDMNVSCSQDLLSAKIPTIGDPPSPATSPTPDKAIDLAAGQPPPSTKKPGQSQAARLSSPKAGAPGSAASTGKCI